MGSAIFRVPFEITTTAAELRERPNCCGKMLFIVFLLLMGPHVTWCKSRSEIVRELFDENHYDHATRPGEESSRSPTRVELTVFVRAISAVDTKKMQMQMQITLRQKWMDQQLGYYGYNFPNSSYISLATTQKIWRPNPQIRNAVSGARYDLVADNSYIRLYPDGTVLTSKRLTIVLRCPMNIANFPFDSQSCPLQIAGYGETKEDIIYFWKRYPLQMARGLSFPKFRLMDTKPGDCDFLTSEERYSCAEVNFFLKRYATPLVLSVMVPSLMWVLIAWFALFIGRDQHLGRLLLPSTSLLALSRIHSKVQSDLPQVPYLKAIDIWMGGCLLFVFITLLEVAVVNLTQKRRLNIVFGILNPISFALLFLLPFALVFTFST